MGWISRVLFDAGDGYRVSTNDGSPEPACDRENLTIQGDTLVDRVHLDGREAVGVEAIRDGERRIATAETVVLCARSVGTPSILLRWAVGPAAQLSEIGVAVTVDHRGLPASSTIPCSRSPSTWTMKREPHRPHDFYSAFLLAGSSDTPFGRPLGLQCHTQNVVGTTASGLGVGALVFALVDVRSRGRLELTSADRTLMRPPPDRPTDMRAVRHSEHGDTEVLSVAEIDRPEPAADELLVEVSAAGVNPVDTYFRDGSYDPVALPFTPGVDFAGTVVETGATVSAFEPGDGVFGTGVGNASRQGSYAEYLTVGTDTVAGIADGVDRTEAGAAPVAAATAWRALIGLAGLDPAERCLVHGGSGGVGHAAVQIAAAVNAHVVTTARPDYHDAVADLGADAVLDYGRDDLAEAVKRAAAGGDPAGSGGGGRSADGPGGGVDVVLDHRLDDYLQFDTEVANPHASIVGIGENDPEAGFSNVNDSRGVDAGYTFMSLFNAPNLAEVLAGVSYLMETGALGIELARTYDLDEAGEAQRAVMEDSFLGKLVIEP